VEANSDSSPQGQPLSLSLSRSLATLVTPTTSTPVQDNISLISPLVFHLASTHLGRDTQRQIHWSIDGPRGSKTPTPSSHARCNSPAKMRDTGPGTDGSMRRPSTFRYRNGSPS
jgi:hypothetical protein